MSSFSLLLVAAVAVSAVSATDSSGNCLSGSGKTCIRRSDFDSWYPGPNDKCFVYGGKLSCFTDTTTVMLHDCYCGAAAVTCDKTFPGLASTCTNVCLVGLDAKAQQTVVDVHNALRAKVAAGDETLGAPGPQPAARNMNKLRWNQEIADYAQRWANNCEFEHNPELNYITLAGFHGLGENIAMTGHTGSTSDLVTQMINSWFSEVKDFPNNNVDPFTYAEAFGHYSQVVWADTTDVGCGFVRRASGSLLVCDYGPAGNYGNVPMYVPGTKAQVADQCTTKTANGDLCA